MHNRASSFLKSGPSYHANVFQFWDGQPEHLGERSQLWDGQSEHSGKIPNLGTGRPALEQSFPTLAFSIISNPGMKVKRGCYLQSAGLNSSSTNNLSSSEYNSLLFSGKGNITPLKSISHNKSNRNSESFIGTSK